MSLLSEQEPPRKGEKTARKVLKLLDLISYQENPISTKEIACSLGVSLPTAYNLLNPLIEEGYVERLSGRSGYRLGPMIPELYQRSLAGSLVSDLNPVLKELSELTGEQSYLALYRDNEMIMADVKQKPGSPKLPEAKVGSNEAAHALAVGKVLLAQKPEEEVRAYTEEHPLEALTLRTITSPRRFERCLKEVQIQGLATDVEEFAEGFCCVAAPVYSCSGRVEASVGLSASSKRFRVEARFFANSVLHAAQEASRIGGYKAN